MQLATPAADPRQLLDHSGRELLQLALSVCGVRFGVLRLAGQAAIASSPALPIEIEEPLMRYATAHQAALVVLDEDDLQDAAAGIRFYAAAKLVDSGGGLRGILALLDDRPRNLTELQKDGLLRIAAQVMRDVEMTETIRALREEQTPRWPLIDDAPVAVFCYGVSSGRLSYVNRKFAECLGYTVQDVLDLDSVTDIIAEDQRDAVREMIRRRETGDDRELRYVTKVRCRDGTVLDAEIHSSIADAGTARIVIGVAVDITTQVTSSRHLSEREEYFRALTDHLSDVIAIVSGDGVLTYLSPSAARVLGYEPEELLGKTTWATVHPEDAGALGAALSEMACGTTSEPREYRFQHKSGSWRTLEVVATNLLDHPQIRGSVLNLHDITDRKRMERELGQLHRLTSLGRLAAQVAHEFNNVMMGIQPMVEAIRRRASNDATVLRFTDVISTSLKRGKRVTTDILRFARPAQLTLRPVDVRDVMEQASDEIRPILGEQIKFKISAPVSPMHVSADPAQLTQVLINLALNARDAMETSGGTLTLEARAVKHGEIAHAGAFVHIAVTDSGSGIAAGDLTYVFEPLFATKHRGTGLGLSVVFQVVAAHQGHISVDSEPGKGTTFHLFIPAASATPRIDEAAPGEETNKRSQSLRVLIVDDDEQVAEGLRLSLEAAGMDVRAVGTGAEVLPAVAEFRPDVMVLDLSLPDEDGRAVYERVASRFPLPVIFSSGHASEPEITRLLDSSRAAFLMKPYLTEELLDAIHRLIGDRQQSHG